ncbi:MAG: UDP-N-acetylmuramate dehydrogenase [Candidatus Brocadiales bacterium]|nr:UDP-N-acetylmuramate dehydrogenase [Candidatus Brocadiales bacterium]MBL7006133.1 UDP-N-acetylmuramate dehydrogenase [Spirochaetia bacterium]
MIPTVRESLEKINITSKILFNESLKKYTSLQCGGSADIFIQPDNISIVRKILLFAKQHAIPVTFLGKGTNVLVSDRGIRGITLQTENLCKITLCDTSFTVECGVEVDKLVISAAENGCQGLEGFYGLPGTIGGSIFGNAGCFGYEISEHLDWVEYITPDSKLIRVLSEDADFSYRSSCFLKNSGFISQMHFTFHNFESPNELIRRCMYYRLQREKKGHYTAPSAGSVFKKPDVPEDHPYFGFSAGSLIEKSGLSGFSVNGAVIADFHANFIINPEKKASSDDVLQLIAVMQKRVKRMFAIDLECEIRFLGD